MSEVTQKTLTMWEKRLLDTTKRNPSISFKSTRGNLRIIYPELPDFLRVVEESEVAIADGLIPEVTPSQTDYYHFGSVRLRKQETYEMDELLPLISKKLNKARKPMIFTNSLNSRQKVVLSNLAKKARLFMEENAVNILYVAVGFLEWFDSKSSKELIKSPLFFLSVELPQSSLQAPEKIDFRQSEIVLNVALIKVMKQFFDYDFDFRVDTEVDYLTNFVNYTSKIQSIITDNRWTISDDIYLSLFKFAKINMVKDLNENNSIIAESPLIRSLTESIELPESHNENPIDLDALITPNNCFHALDADSSQEMAIAMAVAKKSFVLQGPPGTGKSQTITNIITELIGRGKRVLFVAEKKAALDVVYKNLQKVGLQDFALAIHNSEIDKKAVIKELSQALVDRQVVKTVSDDLMKQIESNYHLTKSSLKNYSKGLLTTRRPLDDSLYRLLGKHFSLRNQVDLKFTLPRFTEIGTERLDELKNIITNFQKSFHKLGDNPLSNSWYGLRPKTLTLVEKEQLETHISNCLASLRRILEITQEPNTGFKIGKNIGITRTNEIKDLRASILSIKFYDPDLTMLLENDKYYSKISKDFEKYEFYLAKINENIRLKNVIGSNYKHSWELLNINELATVYQNHRSLIKRAFSRKFKVAKNIMLASRVIGKASYNVVLSEIETIKTYQDNQKSIAKVSEEIYFKKYLDDIGTLASNVNNLYSYKEMFKLVIKGNFEKNIPNGLGYLVENFLKDSHNQKGIQSDLVRQMNLLGEFSSAIESFFEGRSFISLDFETLENSLTKMLTNFHNLDDYLEYALWLKTGRENGLEDFFEKLLSFDSDIKSLGKAEAFVEVFEKRFYHLLIDHLCLSDASLQYKNSNFGDASKKNFETLDKKMGELSKHRVRAEISKLTPLIDGWEGLNHESVVLRKEAQKSRKIKPLRVLFQEIPNLILKLKPCMMMSPLAVSSYLRPVTGDFDVLIFDEASQIKPESAVSSIYRAKQMIVVGDKEQLPPTTFFERDDEETDDVDSDAFESILDLASAVLKTVTLRWHYRSQFEELIAPSNGHIYHDLVTFPEIRQAVFDEGLEYIRVDGVYKNGVNLIEAATVARIVMEHFKKYGNARSLGVVAFGEAQQQAIDDEIMKLVDVHSDVSMFFDPNRNESFFVKNIETVQGDERDTIIICVGYGPDSNGNVSMNFGPLNQSGGYRRLNVAITRSKINLKVVTSLREQDIDLRRTQAEGMIFFKDFLRFAENPAVEKKDNQSEVDFRIVLAEMISELGYAVQTEIGRSDYKIDIAIVDPNDSSKYLLGIECDGNVYKSTSFLRDSERLHEEILEKRGWPMYRIWSTEWYKNPHLELTRLDGVIRKLQEKSNLSDSDKGNYNLLEELTYSDTKNEPIDDMELEFITQKRVGDAVRFKAYPNVQEMKQKLLNDSNKSLENLLDSLVPIHFDDLLQLIPSYYNRANNSSQMINAFKNEVRSLMKEKPIYFVDQKYLMKRDTIVFRQVDPNSTRRNFDRVHHSELQAGIVRLLEVVGVLSKDELINQMSALLGYRKTSTELRQVLMQQILFLQEKMVLQDGELLVLKK